MRFEDTTLLALKLEKGVTCPGKRTEAGKSKGMDSPLEAPEGMQPRLHVDTGSSILQKRKIINVCCLKTTKCVLFCRSRNTYFDLEVGCSYKKQLKNVEMSLELGNGQRLQKC